MSGAVTIENGFAGIDAGAWLVGRGQPTAFRGAAVRRRRKGWLVRDRAALDLVETTDRAWCADATRPFLTHIPCAAPLAAISSKVLVAPAAARTGADLVKVVPMSTRAALCTTFFATDWAVMATASRTVRLSVADGETLAVRPEAVVAWTGNRPTGFVRRLGVWDILLPRLPRDLMLHFHGPCVVWAEGARDARLASRVARPFTGRSYGV